MIFYKAIAFFILCLFASTTSFGQSSTTSKVDYVDTLFENASPLWYEVDTNGTLQIFLTYDHERESPNRAAGHFHFRVHGQANSKLRIEFNNLNNVWNSTPGSVAKELLTAVVSDDGKAWKSIALSPTKEGRVVGELLFK